MSINRYADYSWNKSLIFAYHSDELANCGYPITILFTNPNDPTNAIIHAGPIVGLFLVINIAPALYFI